MEEITRQIEDIEKEIRETPYHKGTEHHIGMLRARIARLKDKIVAGNAKKGGGGGGGYAVKKQGDATVVLIGPPSAGKSTLINKLTNAESKVAPYAFTTVSVIPGMLKYRQAYIQILDVPGLIEGAQEGKGRGKEVLSVARAADLLVFITDPKRLDFLKKLVKELENAGIRINKTPPDIKYEKKLGGGLLVHSNIKQDLDRETVKEVARELGIKNGEIKINEKLTIERLIDAFSKNRIYVPAIYVVNKADTMKAKEKEKIDKRIHLISAEKGDGIDAIKETIWEKLGFVTVYLVRPEDEVNFDNPIVVKKEFSLEDVANKIGTEFMEGKSKAKIWGKGAKFAAQEVSLATRVQDGMQIRFI
ncbi:MAG TPA: GTPase [Patescibacteria group bacterium]